MKTPMTANRSTSILFVALLCIWVISALHPIAQSYFDFPFSLMFSGFVLVFVFLGFLVSLIIEAIFGPKNRVFITLNLIYWLGVTAYFLTGYQSEIPPVFRQLFLWLSFISICSFPILAVLVWKRVSLRHTSKS